MIECKIIKIRDGTVRHIIRECQKALHDGYQLRRCIYFEKSNNNKIDVCYQYLKKA